MRTCALLNIICVNMVVVGACSKEAELPPDQLAHPIEVQGREQVIRGVDPAIHLELSELDSTKTKPGQTIEVHVHVDTPDGSYMPDVINIQMMQANGSIVAGPVAAERVLLGPKKAELKGDITIPPFIGSFTLEAEGIRTIFITPSKSKNSEHPTIFRTKSKPLVIKVTK